MWILAILCDAPRMITHNPSYVAPFGSAHASQGASFAPLAVGVPEACRITGLGRSTMFELIRRREIETRKVGRRRLILTESLTAYIRALPTT